MVLTLALGLTNWDWGLVVKVGRTILQSSHSMQEAIEEQVLVVFGA